MMVLIVLIDYFGFYRRFLVGVLDGDLVTDVARPIGWTHFVLNYIGQNDGHEIKIYCDGVQMASSNMTGPYRYLPGTGRVVVGRQYTNCDNNYASVDVDELLLFNETLTEQNIKHMN